jgi:hypothetical protein
MARVSIPDVSGYHRPTLGRSVVLLTTVAAAGVLRSRTRSYIVAIKIPHVR